MSYEVLSLFAGAGGLSSGFRQAGLPPSCAFEIDPDACGTYRLNQGGLCHQTDLGKTDVAQIKKYLSGADLFAVIGGPPCQGFSTAGGRDAADPRNQLILRHLAIVAELRPRWFLFENVEGLLTSGGGTAVANLAAEFVRIGYSIRLEKVNLAGYGLPQTRKRVLLVGNRLGMDFSMPVETHCYDSGKANKKTAKPAAPTLELALSGLGDYSAIRDVRIAYSTAAASNDYDLAMRAGNSRQDVSLHYQTVSATEIKRFKHLLPGQTMKDLPESLWHESFARRANRRVMDGTPTEKRGGAPSGIKRLVGHYNSLTITSAATREFIHPTQHRALTLRECARLQSFPDHYEFCGSAASVARQIGNAVPPMAAAVFANHLVALDGLLGSGVSSMKLHNNPRLLGFQLTESLGMSPALQHTHHLLQQLQQPALFA